MAINFGNNKIKEIYHGSDKIKEVYYGSELVYTAFDPRGYWVHKNTGVKTYFGLEEPSITNGRMTYPSWAPNCSEVKIPYGVTSLGTDCFYNCQDLTSITLPEGITRLGEYAFYNCHGLTSITLPEGVTGLGQGCFHYCRGLTSITLPESITNIESLCFVYCTSLTLATVLPATPPSIAWGIFDNVHSSFKIKVRSPYVNTYKTATNWYYFAPIMSAI